MPRTTNRRVFLATMGATAAAVVVEACSSSSGSGGSGATTTLAASGSTSTTTLPPTADLAVAHFTDLGYPAQPSLSLITGDEFNGGLRYDGSIDTEPDKGVWVNPCARVEDAGSTDPAVFALFHQVEVHDSTDSTSPEDGLTTALDFLTGPMGLTPDRLGVVSTQLLEPYVPLLVDAGIPDDQILQRQTDEAVAAGDGSGYFAPAGHPAQPQLYTASIHHRLTDVPTTALAHPTGADWIELGELTLNAGPQAGAQTMIWAFGVERLALARGEETLDVSASQQALADTIAAEVAAGATRPPGADAFTTG